MSKTNIYCEKCGERIGGRPWKTEYTFRCKSDDCSLKKGFLCCDCVTPNRSPAVPLVFLVIAYPVLFFLTGYIGTTFGSWAGIITFAAGVGLIHSEVSDGVWIYQFKSHWLCPKCGGGAKCIGELKE